MDNRYRFILLDTALCILFLVVPLMIHLPYRVNIFLSWEGAYRLYLGQVPYKDFGLPMGFGYWIVPALFFKLLGPSFLSLIKAQVFLNGISILSLRGMLYNLRVKPFVVSLSLLVFCLTYVIYQFWPWYNNSVVVFELASFYFLTRALSGAHPRYHVLNLIAAAALAFLSFFTKQDAGALCFVISAAALIYHVSRTRDYNTAAWFIGAYIVIGGLTIFPFLRYDFLYWFNYGQPPHNSRLAIGDLLSAFLSTPSWEKAYLLIFLLILLAGGRQKVATIMANPQLGLLAILTLGITIQAIITQVTSPLPGNITYFHAYCIALLVAVTTLDAWMTPAKNALVMAIFVVVCFSGGYWKYVNGLFKLSHARTEKETASISPSWIPSPFPSFDRVLMPRETVAGIGRLLKLRTEMPSNPKVLNMTELTPLALALAYTPPTNQPLWYHLGIGMFQEQVDTLCARVRAGQYDVVLFEDIPNLTEFYPYQVRDTLRRYYDLEDTFLAPRQMENSTVEVYMKRAQGPSTSPLQAERQ